MALEYALGIDPAYGKPSAYAVIDVEKEEPIAMGTFKDLKELHSVLIGRHVRAKGIIAVFIEDQYTGKNKKTPIKLAQASGEIIGFCKSFYAIKHFGYIQGGDWMRAYLRTKRYPSQAMFKARIVPHTIDRWQLHKLKKNKIVEDVCAAINIGLYGVRRLKTERIVQSA